MCCSERATFTRAPYLQHGTGSVRLIFLALCRRSIRHELLACLPACLSACLLTYLVTSSSPRLSLLQSKDRFAPCGIFNGKLPTNTHIVRASTSPCHVARKRRDKARQILRSTHLPIDQCEWYNSVAHHGWHRGPSSNNRNLGSHWARHMITGVWGGARYLNTIRPPSIRQTAEAHMVPSKAGDPDREQRGRAAGRGTRCSRAMS
ncbi:hypothetical protein F4779DRAFT_232460 [Xylariaceae sp. FL0662B]|nr:hypothetical protein F4779DRAFT_232460 [Xylariaceae sp. FL0662B]